MLLVYNDATKHTLALLRDNLPQSLLLEGLPGVGLLTAAQQLAAGETAAIIRPTDSDGNLDTTAKGIIRVSQIHELQQQARGKSARKQVFIIDDADHMNLQAQNALLKLLEEPSSSVHFILTAHQPHILLPTILSRVQRVTVHPISHLDSQRLISKLGVTDQHKIAQLLFIAEGRPAELQRLIADEKYFAGQAVLVNDARTFISGTLEARIGVLVQYQSDRPKTLQLLEMARSILLFSVQRAPTPELISLLDRLSTTYDAIARNGSVRLQLVNFVI